MQEKRKNGRKEGKQILEKKQFPFDLKLENREGFRFLVFLFVKQGRFLNAVILDLLTFFL